MVSATSTVVASVTAPGIASVAAPVTAPVTTPIPAPVVAPVSVAAPVSAPVTVPVSAPVTAPIPAPVIAPVSVTVPVVASVTASVTAPVSAPVTAPVTVPFTAPIQAPVVAPQVNQLVTTFGALGFGQPPVVPPATVLTPAGPIPAAAAAAMDDATHNALNAVTWDTPPPNANSGPWYAVSRGTCLGLSNNWYASFLHTSAALTYLIHRGLVSPHVIGVSRASFAKRATWYEARRLLLDLRNAGQCEMM